MALAFQSELSARIFSAVLLGPACILIAWFGGIWFFALVTLIAALMYWEWTVMTLRSIDIRRDIALFFAAFCLILLAYAGHGTTSVVTSIFVVVIGCAVHSLMKMRWGWAVVGAGIAALFGAALVHIRSGEQGSFALLIFLCFVIWAADIFAYGFGRTIGGPKLMPSISPKKTWSGFLGGVAGALCFAVLVNHFLLQGSAWSAFFIAIGLAVVAQAGDLLESMVKRRFKVKDSSSLIPGHGGILDRVDGLTLAAGVFVLSLPLSGLV